MPIRPARWSDLPALATMCAAAFYEDELFGTLMHPQRDKYRADYEAYWTRRMRESWWEWTHIWWVAIVQEDGKEVVAGIAEWEFKGTLGDPLRLKAWDPRRAILCTIQTFHKLQTTISPNRAANPDPILHDPVPAAYPFFAHHWKGPRANSIYLDLLCIDPRYRGRGLAQELVQWGLDTARQHHVSASVVSSQAGYKLYRAMGFTDEVGRFTEGEGNPLAKLPSGWILFAEDDTTTSDSKKTQVQHVANFEAAH
ncbi:acyl-CoA N-acyltransferase [Clohesyomyces aquaticus]|uniref:Acyl-CoA N-acyltransferase n=1 Tax=Clohesyomyces aquaticus TaxID=1231657 RepID=A0A1Y1ZMG2_9PLEO|nr:acyl-CoA N-acyltransferase [Clohesyomyces aquaticus]